MYFYSSEILNYDMLSEEKQKEVLGYFNRDLTFIARQCGIYVDEVIDIIKKELYEVKEN